MTIGSPFRRAHPVELAGAFERRPQRRVKHRRNHHGRDRVDRRRREFAQHRRPHSVHREAVDKTLENVGLEHIERDVGPRARRAGQHVPLVVLRLAPAGKRDRAADPSHGKLRDEGDDPLEPVACLKIVEQAAEAGREPAEHRPHQKAAQQRHRIRKTHLAAQQRERDHRRNVDERRHQSHVYDLSGRELFFHSFPPPSKDSVILASC